MATIRTKNKLGQYFTAPHEAGVMLSLAKSGTSSKVLEPSAGEGVFLDLLKTSKFENVTGIEIDPELASNSHHNLVNDIAEVAGDYSWTNYTANFVQLILGFTPNL